MNYKNKIILSIFILIIIFTIIYFSYTKYFPKNHSTDNTISDIKKMSTEVNNNKDKTSKEPIKLSEFSTKLLSKNENRTNNIQISCNTLNGTLVKSGETFSFCKTIGNPTKDKGYKLANSYGHSGEIIQTIGGGNCQVCTTLYNAVLLLDKLEVIERHEHSRPVSYVPKGKDATCAYDYLDFKFKNNYQYSIRIDAAVNNDNVTITIFQIK